MTQERMNNLMILNVHKELTEEIYLFDIAKEFISENESRENVFGRCKWLIWFDFVYVIGYLMMWVGQKVYY